MSLFPMPPFPGGTKTGPYEAPEAHPGAGGVSPPWMAPGGSQSPWSLPTTPRQGPYEAPEAHPGAGGVTGQQVLMGPNGPVGPSMPPGWFPMMNDYIPPPPGWTPPPPGPPRPLPSFEYKNGQMTPTYNRPPDPFGFGVPGSMQQAQYGMGLMPPRSGRMIRMRMRDGTEQNVPEEHLGYYQSQGATLSGY